MHNTWPEKLSGALQPTGGRGPKTHIPPPARKKRLGVRVEKGL
jgi:hypothetical protein